MQHKSPDRKGRRLGLGIALTALLALQPIGTFPAQAQAQLTFRFDAAAAPSAEPFRLQMEEARRRVRGWWGPSFEQPIAVEVTSNQLISMALVPAWRGERGRVIFGSRRVNAGQAPVIHEMIHIYAPNSNRMLAEGLAVYGHEKLGGNPAYPNFGRDLHQLAAGTATKPLLLNLERQPTPEPLEAIVSSGETIAGSFVRFLIERFGTEQFRQLYELTPLKVLQRDPGDPARWDRIYGRSLDEFADLWLAALALGRTPSPSTCPESSGNRPRKSRI
jgi:hypothetical protein